MEFFIFHNYGKIQQLVNINYNHANVFTYVIIIKCLTYFHINHLYSLLPY